MHLICVIFMIFVEMCRLWFPDWLRQYSYVIMAHRHIYNTSQIFEAEPDQHWNIVHPEDPYLHFGNENYIHKLFSQKFSM